MARTGRAKPMTAKAGVTKTKRRYACGGKMKKWWTSCCIR